MRPKTSLLLLLIFPAAIFAEDARPAGFSLTRYQSMLDRSPFALSSEGPAAQTTAPNSGFAKNLYLTGAVRLKSGEYISIGSRDQSQSFALRTGISYNGISLVSVAWSEAMGKTRATLKSGNEFATITFDEANLRSPATQPPTEGAQPPQGNAKTNLPPGVIPPNPSLKPQGSPSPAKRGGRLVRPTPPPS